MVQLRYLQRRMQHHIVNQIGELAQAAADAAGNAVVADDQSLQIALFRRGFAHGFIKGKGLSGVDDQPVDAAACQTQIHRFIFLQTHVHPMELTADDFVVALPQTGQRLLLVGAGKAHTVAQIPHPAQRRFFYFGNLIGHRAKFTKKSSFQFLPLIQSIMFFELQLFDEIPE